MYNLFSDFLDYLFQGFGIDNYVSDILGIEDIELINVTLFKFKLGLFLLFVGLCTWGLIKVVKKVYKIRFRKGK